MVYHVASQYIFKTESDCALSDSPKVPFTITGWFNLSSKNSYLRIWAIVSILFVILVAWVCHFVS